MYLSLHGEGIDEDVLLLTLQATWLPWKEDGLLPLRLQEHALKVLNAFIASSEKAIKGLHREESRGKKEGRAVRRVIFLSSIFFVFIVFRVRTRIVLSWIL